MEVLAAVRVPLRFLRLTVWLPVVQRHVARDWEVPEDHDMDYDDQRPVKDELQFLLRGDSRLGLRKRSIILIITVHGLEVLLSASILIVNVTCLHRLQLDSHRPLRVGPLEILLRIEHS